MSSRGENRLVWIIRCKTRVSRRVRVFSRSERFSGIAEPVSLYLLIVSLTVLEGILS